MGRMVTVKLKNTVKYGGKYYNAGESLSVSEGTAESLEASNSAVIISIPVVANDAAADKAAADKALADKALADKANTSNEGNINENGTTSELYKINGMTEETVDALEAYGIVTLQDVVDSLEEIPGISEKDVAYLKKSAKKILSK